MPLSEFLRMSRRKLESDQQMSTTQLTDLSAIPENDFVELVWDNGQLTMQGQSSRGRKSHNLNNIPPHLPKPRGKYLENGNSVRKGKSGTVESFLDDGIPGVPSADTDLHQHGDLVPWLNYSAEEFLPEVFGVTEIEHANHNTLSSMNKSSYMQTFGNSQKNHVPTNKKLEESIGMNGSSSRTGIMPLRSSHEEKTSTPSFTSGVSDIANCSTSTTKNVVMRDSLHGRPSTDGYLDMKIQKPDLASPGSRSSLSNFPFISRHTSLQKNNLHHSADLSASCSLVGTMANEEKIPANGTNPVESHGLRASNSQKENDSHNQSSYSRKTEQIPSGSKPCEQSYLVKKSYEDQRPSGSQPCEKSCLVKKSYDFCQAEQGKDDLSLHQVTGLDSNKGVTDGVKAAEPAVAASSVCSGSSGDRASNDQPQLKRKCHDIGESEYRSEDVDEESVGARKVASTRGGAGSKRGRAAEVHNLSERRRRDRINEKMRALQELIPNCNKTDKASMLDEAIEYLKTLQLQVQVMSMGTGLWMQPMMFPAGMRHMHATHMPNFAPMGIGVGFGMNMLDMNGGFSMFPVPQTQMQHPHFPSPTLSGPAKFSDLVGPNIPVLGHPGQGHPMSIPQAPMTPFSSHTSTNSSAGVGVTTVGFQTELPSASPTPNIENHAEDKNAQLMHAADVSRMISQASNQLLPTNEGIAQSNQTPLQQKSNQTIYVDGNAGANATNQNVVPEGKAGSN